MNQCGDGTPPSGTCKTRLQKFHAGQTSSLRIQRALRLNYYYTLLQDDKNPKSDTEGCNGPNSTSTSSNPSAGTDQELPSRQREAADDQPPYEST